MSEVPEHLLPFCACPAKALSPSSRTWLSKHLNPEMDSLSSKHSLLQDWRGVAEFLLFTALDIDNFAREKNPTVELLRQWAFQETSTIGKLLEAIEAVERIDILIEEQLAKILERDCTAYQRSIEAQMNEATGGEAQPIQVDEVTSVDEFKNITVNEVNTGIPEHFDAFVCYTHQDFEFVRQMMHKLETVHGLKLCIVSRDLMPGCAVYVIMAKLIQERCRKMIIVLSPDYINSKECEFQTRFAHSLAPGAKEKKLIPVIYRPCPIPPILNHICTVDYTRCDVVEWFWVRLANSLRNAQRGDALIPEQSTRTITLEHRSVRFLATTMKCIPGRIESHTTRYCTDSPRFQSAIWIFLGVTSPTKTTPDSLNIQASNEQICLSFSTVDTSRLLIGPLSRLPFDSYLRPTNPTVFVLKSSETLLLSQ